MPCRTLILPMLAAFAPATPPLRRTALRAASSSATPPFRCLVPIGDGSEEIETSCIVDVLVRSGAAVTLCSVAETTTCTMSRGMRFEADALIGDVADETYDLIACPGGMPGAKHLSESAPLARMIAAQHSRGGLLGAVCAAPAVVFEPLGVLKGREATCYPAPAFAEALPGPRVDAPVVVDGHVVTSAGPGTSLRFALALVEGLNGPESARALAEELLVTDYASPWE